MILPSHILKDLEQAGLLKIKDRQEYGAFSLDLRIGRLLKRKEVKAATVNEHQYCQDRFIDKLCEEVDIPVIGLDLEPNDSYLWQPKERIYMKKGLAGEITSRSSYARLGLRVQSKGVDEKLHHYHVDKDYYPLCTLRTTGTRVRISRDEPLAQLFVSNSVEHCFTKQDYEFLIEKNLLVITKEGKKLSPKELNISHEIKLTLGSDIKLYLGKLLIPGKLKGDEFEHLELSNLEGQYLRKSDFFISASAESVEIPEDCVGYVTERHTIMQLQNLVKRGANVLQDMPFMSHANAPYIGPRSVFIGNITFENQMLTDAKVRPGTKQADLVLYLLADRVHLPRNSRYTNQDGATLSRL